MEVVEDDSWRLELKQWQAQYKDAPDVTRKRMYLETVGLVLQRAGQKVVLDETARGITPLLRMPEPGLHEAAAAPRGDKR